MSDFPKKPGEYVIKERFSPRTGQRVERVEDEVFHARLEHLRDLSNQLNKALQRKLEDANLPFYSWNKNVDKDSKSKSKGINPKVLRLAVLLRPTFLQSDEEKTQSNRFNTSDDQITVFIHLFESGKIQMLRTHEGFSEKDHMALTNLLLPDISDSKNLESKNFIEHLIQEGDMDKFAGYIVDRLKHQPETDLGSPHPMNAIMEHFQRAYKLVSVQQCREYFASESFLYEPREIIRNLGKIAIMSVLETQADLFFSTKQRRFDDLPELQGMLEDKSEEILGIEVKIIGKKGNTEEHKLDYFIPDHAVYIRQTINKLIKEVRGFVMGGGK